MRIAKIKILTMIVQHYMIVVIMNVVVLTVGHAMHVKHVKTIMNKL